jgi:hypothetical protein
VGFWRGWWLAGLAGTTVAWLFEFWPRVFDRQLERISLWHVIAWCVWGGLLECLSRRQMAGRRKLALVIAAVGFMVLVAAAIRGFDWRNLHIVQDERHQRLAGIVSETQPFARGGLDVALKRAWWKYGLLPLSLFALVHRSPRMSLRERWLALVAVVFLGLMLWQIRWLEFFAPALVMAAGVATERCWPKRPWLGVGLIILATLPSWFLAFKISRSVHLVKGDSMRGPYVEMFALRAASDCLGQEAKASIVLAAWDQGGVLAAMGKVRVVGSAYWSNFEGLSDTFEMFTTRSRNRFFELAHKRGIGFVLIPSRDRLERAVWQSALALYGRPPTRTEAFRAYIWQVAGSSEFETVMCQKLSNLVPNWRIARLPLDGKTSAE